MKKIFNKILLTSFTTMLFCILFCFCAEAKVVSSTGDCGSDITWKYNASSGELIISGTGKMNNYHFYTGWDSSPFYESDIKSVSLNLASQA